MKNLHLDNVSELTEFSNITAGGYICVITNVEDVPMDNKTGKGDYLKLEYDIADGEFRGYHTNLAKEKGWDMPSFIKSYKKKALPFFKGMITAVGKSNKNFKWNDDETQLLKKYIGLVLGEEEYINGKGAVKVRLKVDSVHSVEAIKNGDFKVPDKKCIEVSATKSGLGSNPFNKKSTAKDTNVGFFNVDETSNDDDETSADDLPF